MPRPDSKRRCPSILSSSVPRLAERACGHLSPRLYVWAATVAAVTVWLLGLTASAATAGTLTMTSCSTFGDNGLDSDNAGLVWSYSTNGGFSGSTQCWPGSGWVTDPNVFYPAFGNTGKWATVTPPSIQIFAWVTSDPSGSPTY